MKGEYLFEKVNETDLMNESLSTIIQGSEVSSSASSNNFISYGDGVLDDGFYMGSLVTKHLNNIRIGNLTSYIFSIPKNGAYSVKGSKQELRSTIGKTGVLTLSTEKVAYDAGTQHIDDYAIIINKANLNSQMEKKYKLPYNQWDLLALDLRSDKVQVCFQSIESTLKLLRAFPSSRNSVLVKNNLRDIASFMLIDIITDQLNAKPLLNINAEKHLVFTAEEIMEAECKTLFTIQEIADKVFTSPRSLQRAFKKCRNYTPMQFLLKRKLIEANKIFVDNRNPFLTIKEVALEVGILDLNRFSKHYFKQFSQYPKDILKK